MTLSKHHNLVIFLYRTIILSKIKIYIEALAESIFFGYVPDHFNGHI
jgi:hypothetical protein